MLCFETFYYFFAAFRLMFIIIVYISELIRNFQITNSYRRKIRLNCLSMNNWKRSKAFATPKLRKGVYGEKLRQHLLPLGSR